MPLYAHRRVPGVPPVGVLRVRGHQGHPGPAIPLHPHAHDFLVLVLVERGHGTLRREGADRTVEAGDLLVIGPGEEITPDPALMRDAHFTAVHFPADVVAAESLPSWRSHPLLSPFVRGIAGGVGQLHVPEGRRAELAERIAAVEHELSLRRDGYAEAVLAHLTLLLVAVSRLAATTPGPVALRDDALLAAVFDTIEQGFRRPLSLRDVAASVGLSPGHLTTVVGRRTGRTVGQWIDERRMTEARRLLAGTDLTTGEIAVRTGFTDSRYFSRRFRSAHGVTPAEWRRVGRAAAARQPSPQTT